jgi:hypothetical protein
LARGRAVTLLMLAARGAGRLMALTRFDVHAYGIHRPAGTS